MTFIMGIVAERNLICNIKMNRFAFNIFKRYFVLFRYLG